MTLSPFQVKISCFLGIVIYFHLARYGFLHSIGPNVLRGSYGFYTGTCIAELSYQRLVEIFRVMLVDA
jgi:hypothetical protein